VGITELAQRHGHALSGGERQRLAVARALALRPEVLFLDEPTSNIDPESVRIIESAVTNARRAGVTILLSTHNLAIAYRISDIVLPMEAGCLRPDRNNVYHGTVEHTDAPVGRFTFEGGQIVTPALDGAFTAAVVPMDDVILSRRAVASSAQNAFAGRVTETEDFEGLVRVGLDCGFPLSALVTESAIRQLGIAEGAKVHASFKASAVRLF
jgi:molybdopterin-binding protein